MLTCAPSSELSSVDFQRPSSRRRRRASRRRGRARAAAGGRRAGRAAAGAPRPQGPRRASRSSDTAAGASRSPEERVDEAQGLARRHAPSSCRPSSVGRAARAGSAVPPQPASSRRATRADHAADAPGDTDTARRTPPPRARPSHDPAHDDGPRGSLRTAVVGRGQSPRTAVRRGAGAPPRHRGARPCSPRRTRSCPRTSTSSPGCSPRIALVGGCASRRGRGTTGRATRRPRSRGTQAAQFSSEPRVSTSGRWSARRAAARCRPA